IYTVSNRLSKYLSIHCRVSNSTTEGRDVWLRQGNSILRSRPGRLLVRWAITDQWDKHLAVTPPDAWRLPYEALRCARASAPRATAPSRTPRPLVPRRLR